MPVENATFEGLPQAVLRLEQRSERMEKMLSRLIPQSEPERLFNITQAAEFVNLRVPTMYTLVSRGQIPVNKKGKRLYFSQTELLDWIKSGRRKTIAESQANPESHLRAPKRRATL